MDTSVLIIDDNVDFCNSLIQMLSGEKLHVCSAHTGTEALALIRSSHIDVVLLDVKLRESSGIEVLMQLSELYPDIPVIMITGYATIESAVRSIKLGAFDYVQKPVKYDKLLTLIRNAKTLRKLRHENRNLYKRLDEYLPKIISDDPAIVELKSTLERLADTRIAILLHGENGTGKEVFADYFHACSCRKDKNMVKINCAAYPDSLLDNELFGHEKGAFTGATSVYKGVFEQADKGVLFLDEIGDMPLAVQSKVLRVLQNRELHRLGGSSLIKVDVQFLSATNKNLEELIREGRFREDLFYRLNAATIRIPPLRDRKNDIPLLVNHFLEEYARDNGKIVSGVSNAVLEVLKQHNWPGNIRELKNVINYAAAICTKDHIDLEDLPGSMHTGSQKNQLQETEKGMLVRELKRWNNNKKKAAESLNISRSTLYSKMRKHGIF